MTRVRRYSKHLVRVSTGFANLLGHHHPSQGWPYRGGSWEDLCAGPGGVDRRGAGGGAMGELGRLRYLTCVL